MIEIRYDATNTRAMITRLLQQVPGGIAGAVRDGAELVRSDLRTRLSFPRGSYLQKAPRGYLGRRTGELADSIQVQTYQTEDGPAAMIGPVGAFNRMLAVVHEEGRVIMPRRAMYLKVPLPSAMDSRGVPLPEGGLPGPQFVFRSRRGNLLIGYAVGYGRGRSVIPLFALKSLVVIPARRMFSDEAESIQSRLSELINSRIQQFL